MIAAGSSSGIRVNDPVVTADGLVGKVTQVAAPQRAGDAAHRPKLDVSALDVDTQAAGLVSHGEGPRRR